MRRLVSFTQQSLNPDQEVTELPFEITASVMPTTTYSLSKESSLFKKKVTPLIGVKRDSQLLTLIRLIAVPQKEGQPHLRQSHLYSSTIKE